MKNKGFWLAFTAYVLMAFMDLISTFWGGFGVAGVMEANPLLSLGGWPLLIFLNLSYFFLLPWLYVPKKRKVGVRFMILLVVVLMVFVRVFVVYHNFESHELLVSEASARGVPVEVVAGEWATPEAKADTMSFLSVLVYVPLLLVMVFYWLFSWDHIIIRKDLTEKIDMNVSKGGG